MALQANASPSTTANLLVSDSANNRVRSIAGIANVAPVPVVSFSPNPVVFTGEPQGMTSGPLAITVTNTGGAALTVTGFTIGGADASDFAQTTNTCTTGPVAANGGTCTVNVTFTPSALGTRTAAISLQGAFGSPEVALSGTGGTPQANLTPTSLTFTGSAPPAQKVTLANGGDVATIVSAITITGTNAADFKETDNCVGLTGVAPGTSCTINVTFSGTGAT